MKERWIKLCSKLSAEPTDFYAAARKILRNHTVIFREDSWKGDLTLGDIGYTKNKLNRLVKDYLHLASRDKAVELWTHFTKRGSYASASFTTYNHLVKAGATSPSETIETRGPCLQSVVLSLVPTGRGTVGCSVDVFYRTTEFFKKFPADLILLDVLLEPFNFEAAPIISRNFHFAGVTCHPMYVIVPAALAVDPVEFFENIRKGDPQFFKQCVNWTHKYLVTSRGITKFAQAIATQNKGIERLKKNGTLSELTDYIKDAQDAK